MKNIKKTLQWIGCCYESNLKFSVAIYPIVSLLLVPRNWSCKRQHWRWLRIPCESYILMCPPHTPVPGSMLWQINDAQRQLCVATFWSDLFIFFEFWISCELEVYGINNIFFFSQIPTWTTSLVNFNRNFTLVNNLHWQDLTWPAFIWASMMCLGVPVGSVLRNSPRNGLLCHICTFLVLAGRECHSEVVALSTA